MVCKVHEVGYELFKLPLLNYKQYGEEVLDSTFSFFFVRHPFVRLVSAYQDKVSWNSNNYTLIQFKVILFLTWSTVYLRCMQCLTKVYTLLRLRTVASTLACPITKNQTTMEPSSSENLSRDSWRGPMDYQSRISTSTVCDWLLTISEVTAVLNIEDSLSCSERARKGLLDKVRPLPPSLWCHWQGWNVHRGCQIYRPQDGHAKRYLRQQTIANQGMGQ